MALHALAENFAFENIEGGEQVVAFAVVGHSPGNVPESWHC
jgi:hypothetical protein